MNEVARGRARRVGASLFVLILPSVGLGCGSDETSPNADASVAEGGFDAPPGCDLSKDLKDSLPCIDNAVGLFVSPTGADSNPGTKAAPLATIGKALSVGGKPRIYVCDGTYSGSIDVTKPVGIFGGLKCDWSVGGARPNLQGDKPAYAVHSTATMAMTDLEIVAKAGALAGESSVGVFADGASILLKRCAVTAASGASALKPGDIADFPGRAADGNNGDVNNGGGKKDNNCANGTGTSTGGAGGPPGAANGINGSPFATYPIYPLGDDGAGGKTGGNCVLGIGLNGSYGPGGNGGPGAAKVGTLTTAGWAPQSGLSGTNGSVGQGGGGGASIDSNGGGGGGGTGGCGGASGQGGAGGGASIALLLLNAPATLVNTTLTSGKAGDGAQGGTGQKAQQSGTGGPKAGGTTACQGGDGDHGGSGGGGGGGAG